MSSTCPSGVELLGELTCPACGSTVALTAARTVGSPAGRRLAIVGRPRGWDPRSETDVPARGVVLELVDDASLGDPLTFVRHYNAASMDDGGTRWAVLAGADARVGRTLDLARS